MDEEKGSIEKIEVTPANEAEIHQLEPLSGALALTPKSITSHPRVSFKCFQAKPIQYTA